MRKPSSLVCAVIVCISTTGAVWADMASIAILSGEQHVWGHASVDYRWSLDEYHWQTAAYNDSFDSGILAWSNPGIHGETTLPDYPIPAYSTYFKSYATSSVGVLRVDVDTYSHSEASGWAYAGAEGAWVFRSYGGDLAFHGVGDIWYMFPVICELQDLTTGTELFSYDNALFWNQVYPPYGNGGPTFTLEAGHLYRLRMGLETNSTGDGFWGGSLSASAIVIPLPGAALLAMLGLACATTRLRRRRT